jgi:hypothetical protein
MFSNLVALDAIIIESKTFNHTLQCCQTPQKTLAIQELKVVLFVAQAICIEIRALTGATIATTDSMSLRDARKTA